MKKLFLTVLSLLLLPAISLAVPSITSTTEPWVDGGSIDIVGTGFGTKSTAAPWTWDDFESCDSAPCKGDVLNSPSALGSDTTDWSTYNNPVYDDTQAHSGSLSSLHDYTDGSTYNLYFKKDPPGQYFYVTYWTYTNTVAGTRNSGVWNEKWVGYYTSDNLARLGMANSANGSRTGFDDADWDYHRCTNEDGWSRVESLVQFSSSAWTKTWVHNQNHTITLDADISGKDDDHDISQIRFARYFRQSGGDKAKIYIDDVYIDITRARVEIGNNATWSSCTHREIQIPSAWTDTSATITINLGSIPSADITNGNYYLFVVDSNGVASAGHQITGKSIAITGAAAGGLTEAEVVTGSKTVIYTVSNDTFVATLGADNAITTAFIADLDSGGSEANGWNARVKALIDYTMVSVDGTKTICTVTLPPAPNYNPTTNETITPTVPANCLTGGVAIVGSPIFEITASDPACSMTGTLSDNATEAEVKAGSETLIGTVSDTELVATFGDNNAITTAFIALIDSAQSEAGGWDARVKAALDHTMISRDNATQWTLTTPVAAGYDISANETITVKLPTTATTSGIEITCMPTADIIFFETSSEEIRGITMQ